MATLTPSTALSYAKRFVKNGRVDDATTGVRILDDANKMLWMIAPWSWTLGALDPVTFVDGTQDYAVVDPGDFLRIQWAARSNNDRLEQIGVVPALPVLAGHKGPPKKVSHVSTGGGNVNVRFWPVPNSTDKSLLLYKKVTTEVTSGNQGTPGTLLFPDEFYPLYQELVLYKAWQFFGDPRAGGAQSNGQQNVYSGQLGWVMALVREYLAGEPHLMDALGLDLTQR